MKRNPILMALTSLLVLGGTPSFAAANAQTGTCGPDLIPIIVPATQGPSGYIIPNCSKCKKLTLERQSTATGGTEAVLGLTFHDGQGDFTGDIELTVVLDDDTEHLVVIEDVGLTEGQHAVWVIGASSTWSWNDASVTWIELVAT